MQVSIWLIEEEGIFFYGYCILLTPTKAVSIYRYISFPNDSTGEDDPIPIIKIDELPTPHFSKGSLQALHGKLGRISVVCMLNNHGEMDFSKKKRA